MKIEEFLDCAVDAEDFDQSTNSICKELSGIREALESQVEATHRLSDVMWEIAVNLG